ncbi:MAG TPA: STAS/SEC14 domain-containing protein [Candidatus Limnocylindrales bacterium]
MTSAGAGLSDWIDKEEERAVFEPITGLPAGVIGFEAVGRIEARDYEEALMPAIARGAEEGGVRIVLVLGDRFTGYSTGGMREDAGLALSRGTPWRRTALVSDLGWVAHLSSAFGWMVPGKFKRFGLAERDAAIAWVAEPE